MKLSFNLRDENQRSPLFKAKIPVTVFSQPFTSTVSANLNTPQDPSFSVSTNYSSGPSARLSYSASTTTVAPFTLSLKSGLGLSGSPRNSPLIFSAHFSLSSTNPSTITSAFSIHFKPQFGHFSLLKTTSSNPNPNSKPNSGSHTIPEANSDSGSRSNGQFGDGLVRDGWQEVKLEPCGGNDNGDVNANSDYTGIGPIGFMPERSLVSRDGKNLWSSRGVAIKARTVLPVTNRVAMNLRWGLNLPADLKGKVPYLTLDKIGIVRVEEVKEVKTITNKSDVGDVELLKGMYLWMKRDLEVLEKENMEMRQSLEGLRSGISSRKSYGESNGGRKTTLPPPNENMGEFDQWRSKRNGEAMPTPNHSLHHFEQWRGKKNGEGSAQRESKKPANQVTDLESELQKAIKAASL
ncbi:hypothetical protein HS088_TW15G00590 [Tripterygium wilfordii]|uniref:Uncharacterized protein n=1 Tax=Tripterygium wilfordii TaxID=458696 RepID=A0A7J7CLZ9_TRIWF|nr:uncharacterized protein LOC119980014 [Tripterygium wilfordii]KAF5735090.1 hypothetical protein HS088_TW15G00590 [Tripterygium wilfordii]